MNIITIQHTEAQHHINGMVGSWNNDDLTEKGMKQADWIIRNISGVSNLSSYMVASSDLKRCSEIAEKIHEVYGCRIKISKDLRGKYYGNIYGRTDKWLSEHKLPVITDERDIHYKYLEDGENTIELYGRLSLVFDALIAEDSNLIIVGHGDVLNLFYIYWLKIKIDALEEIDIFTKPGAVSFFKTTENGKHIAQSIGDMSFIRRPI